MTAIGNLVKQVYSRQLDLRKLLDIIIEVTRYQNNVHVLLRKFYLIVNKMKRFQIQTQVVGPSRSHLPKQEPLSEVSTAPIPIRIRIRRRIRTLSRIITGQDTRSEPETPVQEKPEKRRLPRRYVTIPEYVYEVQHASQSLRAISLGLRTPTRAAHPVKHASMMQPLPRTLPSIVDESTELAEKTEEESVRDISTSILPTTPRVRERKLDSGGMGREEAKIDGSIQTKEKQTIPPITDEVTITEEERVRPTTPMVRERKLDSGGMGREEAKIDGSIQTEEKQAPILVPTIIDEVIITKDSVRDETATGAPFSAELSSVPVGTRVSVSEDTIDSDLITYEEARTGTLDQAFIGDVKRQKLLESVSSGHSIILEAIKRAVNLVRLPVTLNRMVIGAGSGIEVSDLVQFHDDLAKEPSTTVRDTDLKLAVPALYMLENISRIPAVSLTYIRESALYQAIRKAASIISRPVLIGKSVFKISIRKETPYDTTIGLIEPEFAPIKVDGMESLLQSDKPTRLTLSSTYMEELPSSRAQWLYVDNGVVSREVILPLVGFSDTFRALRLTRGKPATLVSNKASVSKTGLYDITGEKRPSPLSYIVRGYELISQTIQKAFNLSFSPHIIRKNIQTITGTLGIPRIYPDQASVDSRPSQIAARSGDSVPFWGTSFVRTSENIKAVFMDLLSPLYSTQPDQDLIGSVSRISHFPAIGLKRSASEKTAIIASLLDKPRAYTRITDGAHKWIKSRFYGATEDLDETRIPEMIDRPSFERNRVFKLAELPILMDNATSILSQSVHEMNDKISGAQTLLGISSLTRSYSSYLSSMPLNIERPEIMTPLSIPGIGIQNQIQPISTTQQSTEQATRRPVGQTRPIEVTVETDEDLDVRELERRIARLLKDEARRYGIS